MSHLQQINAGEVGGEMSNLVRWLVKVHSHHHKNSEARESNIVAIISAKPLDRTKIQRNDEVNLPSFQCKC